MFFIIPAIILAFGFSGCKTSDSDEILPIVSPYSGIDWQNYGQYKAVLHAHTMNSDGVNLFWDVIEEHYNKNYDIVAIMDHDVLTIDWVSAADGLTQERFTEISCGTDRDGRGMLQIPYTIEQSQAEHLNTFFVNYINPDNTTLGASIKRVEELGGISHINHPGRYTGGEAGGINGENASNNPQNIQKYVDLFMEFPSCVGMEIINKKDGESTSDRILWDNILKRTIPQGRYVWGFSNDDTHWNNDTGYSFNVFVMPENTLDNFKAAILSGSFYAVAKVSRRELGDSFEAEGPVPVITGIEVNNSARSVTITAGHYSKIEWISEGTVIAEGNTIRLENHEQQTGCYIRANIIGPGGIAFTQPFGINNN